jgi:hypothetical protein
MDIEEKRGCSSNVRPRASSGQGSVPDIALILTPPSMVDYDTWRMPGGMLDRPTYEKEECRILKGVEVHVIYPLVQWLGQVVLRERRESWEKILRSKSASATNWVMSQMLKIRMQFADQLSAILHHCIKE